MIPVKPDRKNENHHYVPLFYLRQWCDANGRLWVYPTDGRPGFSSAPKNFAAEKGLYDTSTLPELSSIDEEGDLSEIEGLYASTWPEVFDGTTDPETKMNLSRFLALTHLRHPHRKNDVRELHSALRKMVEMAGDCEEIEVIGRSGERVRVRISDIRAYASDTAANTNAGFFGGLHRSIEDLALILNARKWAVIVSADPVFVTSDAPLVLGRGECTKAKFGFGTPGTIVTFPISPTKLLRMSETYERDGLHYPLLRLGDLNDNTVSGADRFVFRHRHLD